MRARSEALSTAGLCSFRCCADFGSVARAGARHGWSGHGELRESAQRARLSHALFFPFARSNAADDGRENAVSFFSRCCRLLQTSFRRSL